MSDAPEPPQRLNVLLEGLTIAHETIYDLHSRLVSGGGARSRSDVLLAESAHIVRREAPDASAAARVLANRWQEQSVLDPEAADLTALELDDELTHTEAALRELLGRQRVIAAELRALDGMGWCLRRRCS